MSLWVMYCGAEVTSQAGFSRSVKKGSIHEGKGVCLVIGEDRQVGGKFRGLSSCVELRRKSCSVTKSIAKLSTVILFTL
jgi:hypothetical protein